MNADNIITTLMLAVSVIALGTAFYIAQIPTEEDFIADAFCKDKFYDRGQYNGGPLNLDIPAIVCFDTHISKECIEDTNICRSVTHDVVHRFRYTPQGGR